MKTTHTIHAAEAVMDLVRLGGPDAEHVGLVLVAIATAVQRHDAAALARLAAAAVGEAPDASRAATARPRTPGDERRRRGLVRATVRGAIRRHEEAAGWASGNVVLGRVLGDKRLRAGEAEVLEALAELEAAGEIERRVTARKGSNAPVGEVRLLARR